MERLAIQSLNGKNSFKYSACFYDSEIFPIPSPSIRNSNVDLGQAWNLTRELIVNTFRNCRAKGLKFLDAWRVLLNDDTAKAGGGRYQWGRTKVLMVEIVWSLKTTELLRRMNHRNCSPNLCHATTHGFRNRGRTTFEYNSMVRRRTCLRHASISTCLYTINSQLFFEETIRQTYLFSEQPLGESKDERCLWILEPRVAEIQIKIHVQWWDQK